MTSTDAKELLNVNSVAFATAFAGDLAGTVSEYKRLNVGLVLDIARNRIATREILARWYEDRTKLPAVFRKAHGSRSNTTLGWPRHLIEEAFAGGKHEAHRIMATRR